MRENDVVYHETKGWCTIIGINDTNPQLDRFVLEDFEGYTYYADETSFEYRAPTDEEIQEAISEKKQREFKKKSAEQLLASHRKSVASQESKIGLMKAALLTHLGTGATDMPDSATITTRTDIDYGDEERLLRQLNVRFPQFVRTVQTINKAEIKKDPSVLLEYGLIEERKSQIVNFKEAK